MDLQLYQVDRENYLVDFRNIGYYPATHPEPSPNESRSVALGENQQPDEHMGFDSLGSATGRKINGKMENGSGVGTGLGGAGGAGGGQQGATIGGVSGPFHFLEMACQLIAELASG